MTKRPVKTGDRLGPYTVLERLGRRGSGVLFRVLCNGCNQTMQRRSGTLLRAQVANAKGCIKCLGIGRRIPDVWCDDDCGSGRAITPEYAAWSQWKCKCYTPSHPRYDTVGGAGITMCEAWRESFQAFLADLGKRPDEQHVLALRKGATVVGPDTLTWTTRRDHWARVKEKPDAEATVIAADVATE